MIKRCNISFRFGRTKGHTKINRRAELEEYSLKICRNMVLSEYIFILLQKGFFITGLLTGLYPTGCKNSAGNNNNNNNNNNNWRTGTISKSFIKYVITIPGNHDVKKLQKTATLGTAHILRKVLM
jgi:hypothetical protein